MKRKRISLWDRADVFAGRNVVHARRFMNTPTGLWEYLRFAYMAGWIACNRRRRYEAKTEAKHG
jgi:hypothetical protein